MKHTFFFIFLSSFFIATFAQKITTSEWKQFVPSNVIPSNIKCKNSNNNLDLVAFNGKYYCAFRTAPTHFASKKTK